MSEVKEKAVKKVTKKKAAKKVALPPVPKNFGENFNGHLAKEDTCTILRVGHEIVMAEYAIKLEESQGKINAANLSLMERDIKEQEYKLVIEKYKVELAKLLNEKELAKLEAAKDKHAVAVKRHHDLAKSMESSYGINISEYSFDVIDFSLVHD